MEDKYVRAVRGGIGFAKTGGNYAASIRAGEIAEEKGYTQVCCGWTAWSRSTSRKSAP